MQAPSELPGAGLATCDPKLQRGHAHCLRAFRRVFDDETHPLSSIQVTETLTQNIRVVDENILVPTIG